MNRLNKLLAIGAILFSMTLHAQSPEKLTYQSVIRDANGALVSSGSVGLQISILKTSATGTAVFVETHATTSNDNGLISIEIGGGNNVSGSINSIDWGDGPYFLKTEIDPAGGTTYTIEGTSQLLTVPYAFHATTAESIPGSVADGITSADTANWNSKDPDDMNEIQMLSYSGNTIYLNPMGDSIVLPFDSSGWQMAGDTIYVDSVYRVAVGTSSGEGRFTSYVGDNSLTNTAVLATAETQGFNRAILGRSFSETGNTGVQVAVVGLAENRDASAPSGTGWHVGVAGEANGSDASNSGVEGRANGQGFNNWGILGQAGDSAIVRNYGGYLVSNGTSPFFNVGALCFAQGTHNRINYGVYSFANNADTNYAAFFAGDVSYTGTLTGPSDRKLKTNIQSYSGALNKIMGVGTYTYEYKTDAYPSMHLPKGSQIGFISQDLEQQFPELVNNQTAASEAIAGKGEASEGDFINYKGVNYTGMIPVLTQAIKEQQAIIEALEKRIEELEKR